MQIVIPMGGGTFAATATVSATTVDEAGALLTMTNGAVVRLTAEELAALVAEAEE